MLRYIYRFNQPRSRDFEKVLADPMDEELRSMIRQQNVLVIDDACDSFFKQKRTAEDFSTVQYFRFMR